MGVVNYCGVICKHIMISSSIILRQHYYDSVNYDALEFSRIVLNLFVKSKLTFSSLYSRCIASLVVDFEQRDASPVPLIRCKIFSDCCGET